MMATTFSHSRGSHLQIPPLTDIGTLFTCQKAIDPDCCCPTCKHWDAATADQELARWIYSMGPTHWQLTRGFGFEQWKWALANSVWEMQAILGSPGYVHERYGQQKKILFRWKFL